MFIKKTSPNITKPVYFKGLNGIRAIASIIVVIWHTDQKSYLFGAEKVGFHKNGMAGNAVDMFFVLSGFLITYLLLIEKERTNTIDFKKYYLRRIFRIWPLYYLSIFITLVLIYFKVVPDVLNLGYSIFLYLFLMVNVAYVLKVAISTITPLWSVGVEEQFYLIWPHVIKRTSNYIKVFVLIFFGYLLLKTLVYVFFTPSSYLFNIIAFTRIDIMCLGAIGAYLVYSKNTILKYIYRKDIQIIAWLVLLYSVVFEPLHIISFLDKEINAFFYFIIILNVSTNTKSLLSLEHNLFNFFGKISYGIYVYHMIVIYLLSYFLKKYTIEINHPAIFILVFLSTILVAWLSFNWFEKPFLKMKHRFTVIDSTNTK